MFKKVGCFFRCAGCAVLVILILAGIAVGGYYLAQSLGTPLIFPQTGAVATIEEADNHIETFRARVSKAFSKPREKGISFEISEKDIAALLLKSWNDTRRFFLVVGKELTLPKMEASRVWAGITESGFETILQIHPVKDFQASQKPVFLRVKSELFNRNGKLYITITHVESGKVPLPHIITSPVWSHIEKKWFDTLNDSRIWQNGSITDLQVSGNSLRVRWIPADSLPERTR